MKNKNFRSEKARMRRSLDDMVRTRDTMLRRAKKAKLALTKIYDKKEMKAAAEEIRSVVYYANGLSLIIETLKDQYKILGIDLGKLDPEPLPPREVEEVTALRYSGLRGKPLYTIKELARQYGTTEDVIRTIDANVPM